MNDDVKLEIKLQNEAEELEKLKKQHEKNIREFGEEGDLYNTEILYKEFQKFDNIN
jgi:hypothetical protein